MDNIFAEANTIADEAEEVAKGKEFIEQLDEVTKDLPEVLLVEELGSLMCGICAGHS